LLDLRELVAKSIGYSLQKLPLLLQGFLQASVCGLWVIVSYHCQLTDGIGPVLGLCLNPIVMCLCFTNEAAKVSSTRDNLKAEVVELFFGFLPVVFLYN
jgi:hypothetical protein